MMNLLFKEKYIQVSLNSVCTGIKYEQEIK